ncbi:hypothetical protein [Rhizobium sp. 57MFTsu3.2]|uniref:hypothetical protein n=1 Tax=Rhizobium sp. 57MFTsu3.2 TaxID=1048681 RepID=UPI00146ED5C7|nr:hypothetical protein [Rhizobium sp. 57MFTsu3.2]NMN73802.1 hypothetical protein [Rhizobium sp. 57MFTsu3.2]
MAKYSDMCKDKLKNALHIPIFALILIGYAIQIFTYSGFLTKNITINAAEIQSEKGAAYRVDLSSLATHFPFRIASDANGSGMGSSIELRESGLQLGPPHAQHDHIRNVGKGAYSHWGGELYFSSSDGTDPRTNGRTYQVAAVVGLNPLVSVGNLAITFVFALFWGRWLLAWYSRNETKLVLLCTGVVVVLACRAFVAIAGVESTHSPLDYRIASALLTAAFLALSTFAISFDVLSLKHHVSPLARRCFYLLAAFVLVAAAGFSFGLLPPVNIGAAGFEPMRHGQAKPAGLALAILWHALGGFLIALLPLFLGAGLLLWTKFGRELSFHGLLVAGYPIGLTVLAIATGTVISITEGWLIPLSVAMIATAGWVRSPPDFKLLRHYMILAAILCPFGFLYAEWTGLDWHGPFNGANGLTSGDLSFYANSIWVLAAHGFPMRNLGVDGDLSFHLFGMPNMVLSALGATGIRLVPLDPYLFLTSTTTMIYVVGLGVLLAAFLSDVCNERPLRKILLALGIAVVAAGRYPYWMAESPPVPHAILLAVSVVWYMERASGNVFGIIVGILSGLTGSAVSKVVSAPFFVSLSASTLNNRLRHRMRFPKSIILAGAAIVLFYFVYMISTYGRLFLLIGRFGPETYQHFLATDAAFFDVWPFISRDAGVLLLIAASLISFPGSIGGSLVLAFVSFIAYSFLFQINMVVGVLTAALLLVTHPPDVFRRTSFVWFLGFGLAVPAMLLTDASGIATAPIWIAVAFGVVGCGFAFVTCGDIAFFPKVIMIRLSLYALVALGLAVIAIERGQLSVQTHPASIPYDAMEIWSQVRARTSADTIIFTDQTSPDDSSLIGGWNSVALSGTRQVYVAGWLQSSLRTDADAKRRRFDINEAVLSGSTRPNDVATSRPFHSFAAVVHRNRVMPAGWGQASSNAEWSLYVWSGT